MIEPFARVVSLAIELAHSLPSILWAWAFLLVYSLLHELGHLTAARIAGVSAGKLAFTSPPDSGLRVRFPGVLFPDGALRSVPYGARRLIYLAGFLTELASFCAIGRVLMSARLPHEIDVGLQVATIFRLAICWGNLVPVASIKSDGWRFLHPDADD